MVEIEPEGDFLSVNDTLIIECLDIGWTILGFVSWGHAKNSIVASEAFLVRDDEELEVIDAHGVAEADFVAAHVSNERCGAIVELFLTLAPHLGRA